MRRRGSRVPMTASSGRRRWVGLMLLGYVAVLAFFLLLPTSEPASSAVGLAREWLLRLGVSDDRFDASRAEFVANIAIFVPFVVLLRGAWPRLRWQDCVAYGFLVSACVEGVQALALAGRSATMADLVANTAGALLGGLVGEILWRGDRGAGGPLHLDEDQTTPRSAERP